MVCGVEEGREKLWFEGDPEGTIESWRLGLNR